MPRDLQGVRGMCPRVADFPEACAGMFFADRIATLGARTSQLSALTREAQRPTFAAHLALTARDNPPHVRSKPGWRLLKEAPDRASRRQRVGLGVRDGAVPSRPASSTWRYFRRCSRSTATTARQPLPTSWSCSCRSRARRRKVDKVMARRPLKRARAIVRWSGRASPARKRPGGAASSC